jgi:hypothetical protein
MRIAMLVLMVACGTSDTGSPHRVMPDAETDGDQLALRLERCGAPMAEPAKQPATMTDAHGNTLIVLDPQIWDGYAAYMDASKAWGDCIVYGVALSR